MGKSVVWNRWPVCGRPAVEDVDVVGEGELVSVVVVVVVGVVNTWQATSSSCESVDGSTAGDVWSPLG